MFCCVWQVQQKSCDTGFLHTASVVESMKVRPVLTITEGMRSTGADQAIA